MVYLRYKPRMQTESISCTFSVWKMDLEEIVKLENRSGSEDGFLSELPAVSIPYLSVLCFATICGTIGNTLVIAAVLSNKVRKESKGALAIFAVLSNKLSSTLVIVIACSD